MGLGLRFYGRRHRHQEVKLNVRDDVKLFTTHSFTADGTLWHDDAPFEADWRTSSKEEVLKTARMWHPQEDAWLKRRKVPSASERATRNMESYI